MLQSQESLTRYDRVWSSHPVDMTESGAVGIARVRNINVLLITLVMIEAGWWGLTLWLI